MSGFSVRIITTHGQALIAQATSGNRLVPSCMRVSGTAMTAAQAAAAVVGDFSLETGAIISSSVPSGSTARICAKFQNPGSSELHLKSFALCGYLENDPTEQVIAVLSGDDVDLVLAANGTPGDTTSQAFNITISGGGSVLAQVTTAGSAALTDLDRFVSCHAPGDPYAGEPQTIWGSKTFRAAINPIQGLSWPAMPISGSDVLVESQLTGFTGGGTQEVHHVFRMTDQTHSVTHGLKCVFDGPSEKMTLSSDVDRVELPTLAIAPDYDGGGTVVRLGQILLIHIARVVSGSVSVWAGMTVSTPDFNIYVAQADTGLVFKKGDTDLTGYTFKAMCEAGTLSTGSARIILAQCVGVPSP